MECYARNMKKFLDSFFINILILYFLCRINYIILFPLFFEDTEFPLFNALLIIFSFSIFILCLFWFLFFYKQEQKKSFLLSHGLRIQGTVTKISPFTLFKKFHFTKPIQWKILFQGDYKGTPRFFSIVTCKNPEKIISPGDRFTILVDPQNPERYIIQHNLPPQYT